MRHALILAATLALAACADWPDTGAPPATRAGAAWPTLLPIDALVADQPPARVLEAPGRTLAARAAALRARAALLRRDVSTEAEMEALRARLAG